MDSLSVICPVESYHKESCFNNWYRCLKYFFNGYKIKNVDKMDYFKNQSEPTIFGKTMVLFLDRNKGKILFNELISMLENRLNKIEPDLGQTYKFKIRLQNPNDTEKNFVMAIQFKAEFYELNNFKELTILDRFITENKVENLRQRLLCEEKLTLAKAKEIIATWEDSKANTGVLEIRLNLNTIQRAAIQNGSKGKYGTAHDVLKLNRDFGWNFKRDLNKVAEDSKSPQDIIEVKSTGFRYEKWRKDLQRSDNLQMEIHLCGIKKHWLCIRSKWRNLLNYTVILVDPHKDILKIYGKAKVLIKFNGNEESMQLRMLNGVKNFLSMWCQNWFNVNNSTEEISKMAVVQMKNEDRLLDSLRYANYCSTFFFKREVPEQLDEDSKIEASLVEFLYEDWPERVDRGVDESFIDVLKLQYLFLDNGPPINSYGP